MINTIRIRDARIVPGHRTRFGSAFSRAPRPPLRQFSSTEAGTSYPRCLIGLGGLDFEIAVVGVENI